MTNADKFKTVFGMYSEEFWAKPEQDMLSWINSEYQEPKSKVDVNPMQWIPVTERLPKEVGWYLVVVLAPFKQVRMYEFYPVHNNCGNDLWRNNDGDHVSNWFVTHWMPLPKPPKDGET